MPDYPLPMLLGYAVREGAQLWADGPVMPRAPAALMLDHGSVVFQDEHALAEQAKLYATHGDKKGARFYNDVLDELHGMAAQGRFDHVKPSGSTDNIKEVVPSQRFPAPPPLPGLPEPHKLAPSKPQQLLLRAENTDPLGLSANTVSQSSVGLISTVSSTRATAFSNLAQTFQLSASGATPAMPMTNVPGAVLNAQVLPPPVLRV